jgi:hypothetical protein
LTSWIFHKPPVSGKGFGFAVNKHRFVWAEISGGPPTRDSYAGPVAVFAIFDFLWTFLLLFCSVVILEYFRDSRLEISRGRRVSINALRKPIERRSLGAVMPQRSQVPKNWPADLPYLELLEYSQTLKPIHLSAIKTPSKDSIPSNTTKGPCPLVKIAPITSPSHPAFGQSGLFAAKDLRSGTFILQYLGEIHASPLILNVSDPHAHSDYDLSLDREHGIGIDADKRGNEARFINDYRGIAERSNAEFKEIWDERQRERGMGVWVLGEGKNSKGKGIRKGEEILVSYGRGFWGARKTEHEDVAKD